MTGATHQSGDSDTPIRDAACLILVDRNGPEPRLLLGRRLPTQVFLPNKWVFPGGRVDAGDLELARHLCDASGLSSGARRQGGPSAMSETSIPFALAAIREMFEETGLFVGRIRPEPASAGGIQFPPAWQSILDRGLVPDFDQFRPLARAITPPGFPRRFDTWFFINDWQADTEPVGPPDGEFSALDWFTLADARTLDLPLITQLIVDDVATALASADGTALTSPTGAEIPFYFQDQSAYRRVLFDPGWA